MKNIKNFQRFNESQLSEYGEMERLKEKIEGELGIQLPENFENFDFKKTKFGPFLNFFINGSFNSDKPVILSNSKFAFEVISAFIQTLDYNWLRNKTVILRKFKDAIGEIEACLREAGMDKEFNITNTDVLVQMGYQVEN